MKRPPPPIICGFCGRATDVLVSAAPDTYTLRCLACAREVTMARVDWSGPAAAARALGLTALPTETPLPALPSRIPTTRRRTAR